MTEPVLCVLPHGCDPNGEPIHREADEGFLCRNHFNRMGATVREVGDLWADLAFIVEAGSAPKDETPKTRHLKSAEAPAPANLEVLSLRDPRSLSVATAADPSNPIPSLVSIVASWTMLLAEERPLTATLPRSAMAQLGLLQVHHRWIAAQPFVDDYLNEMVGLRKALSAALRDHTHKQVGRCRLPVEGREGPCGGALIEENGTDTIKCQDCHAQWSEPHERARLAMSLESA
jgi:hypothetical protein